MTAKVINAVQLAGGATRPRLSASTSRMPTGYAGAWL